MKNIRNQRNRVIHLLIILCCICFNMLAEEPQKTGIPIQNEGGERSINASIIISVSYDKMNLYVEKVSENSALSLCLYIGRICVLEEHIPSGVSSLTIPIFQLEKGQVYQLEIISQQGERWTGAFLFE